MEEVPGIPGALPSIAPFPPVSIRETILPEEWQACLDAWIFAVEFRLRLLAGHFRHLKLSGSASGLPFLLAYTREWEYDPSGREGYRPHVPKEVKLHRHCFLLSRRLLLETDLPYDCPSSKFFALIANGSAAFRANAPWKETLQGAWKRGKIPLLAAVDYFKGSMIETLAQTRTLETNPALLYLRQSTALVKTLAEAGAAFMTGSDYLDSTVTAYAALQAQKSEVPRVVVERELTENTLVCLRSLMGSTTPRSSLLLDHIYSLKGASDESLKTAPSNKTLLSALVCTTTFLKHLDIFLSANAQKRGKDLLAYLHLYREKMSHLHVLPSKRLSKIRKNKGKAFHSGDIHIHNTAQISQIHDLFPELSTSYAIRLLDYFSDDVEAVIAALLEPESLPTDLQDRNEGEKGNEQTLDESGHDVSPRPTPQMPLQRRNIFDGDDFDNLRISSSRIHMGRKAEPRNLDDTRGDATEHAKSKAAILAALAAFDSDDDERDDTYDVADVGGTVDSTLDTDSRSRLQKPSSDGLDNAHEELLFKAWQNSPPLFARDSKTRLSLPRQQMKRETGMGDEQIEGWAVMLGRDPVLRARLEKRYSGGAGFGGNQGRLARTKWQESRSGTATEEDDDDGDGDGGRGLNFRGSRARGFPCGRGIGRGGASTDGSSADPATQAARRRKEQGRGRGGANHDRREGRAKKIGKGMAGPPT